jgi:hypothetical protein
MKSRAQALLEAAKRVPVRPTAQARLAMKNGFLGALAHGGFAAAALPTTVASKVLAGVVVVGVTASGVWLGARDARAPRTDSVSPRASARSSQVEQSPPMPRAAQELPERVLEREEAKPPVSPAFVSKRRSQPPVPIPRRAAVRPQPEGEAPESGLSAKSTDSVDPVTAEKNEANVRSPVSLERFAGTNSTEVPDARIGQSPPSDEAFVARVRWLTMGVQKLQEGHPREALAAARHYLTSWPEAEMRAEAAALEVMALCALNDPSGALQAYGRIEDRDLKNPAVRRLANSCATRSTEVSRPGQ